MKPCRSPYCECPRDQCSHPGFYDARHEPYTHMQYHQTNTSNPVDFPQPKIKHTHQTAYNYCMALKLQRDLEQELSKILQMINLDNQVFGLADAVEGPYTDLVHELIGDNLFEWLMWWMYETEFGTKDMEFIIEGTSYDPTSMTLYRFLELVDD